ncbi:hypothetical protein CAPTEDRAFT_220103 [Capitella teleta]|uniref:MAGE domain-containing protein n=1 Tax=Capitella teleta TaxID=283909 RepID=R7THC3_CAPTE|nr:hypothetical protein CAPTEDRAFT_220103 [Capitella teleta]|eukprot:ELT90520.1 hypothetical protein CAPTEDRAFT_220103 [Capitella teleta]
MADETQLMFSQEEQTVSKQSKVLCQLSAEEISKIVVDLVRYLLIMSQKKLPIKRSDINKTVLGDKSRGFDHFIEMAKERLSLVFGMELIELELNSKSYILLSEFQDHPYLNCYSAGKTECSLLMIILSFIFMNGNVISDNQLYDCLRRIGIDIEFHHEVFGDVENKLKKDYVRQGYVEYSRVVGAEPVQHEFKWGLRARKELSKLKVLDFVAKIYGEEDPSNWTSQWEQANAENAPNES